MRQDPRAAKLAAQAVKTAKRRAELQKRITRLESEVRALTREITKLRSEGDEIVTSLIHIENLRREGDEIVFSLGTDNAKDRAAERRLRKNRATLRAALEERGRKDSKLANLRRDMERLK